MDEFMTLYEDVYKDLYKIAYYYMGQKAEAEDSVSEAVLKAYENFSKLKSKDAFRPWITKILVNTCKSRMRTWFNKNANYEDIDLRYEQDFTVRPALEAALKELTDKERLIVALYVFGGYKGEEISVMLKLKHSTIRSKYHRALLKMKNKLEA